MRSDWVIVNAFSHELFELSKVQQLFAKNGWSVRASTLGKEINPGVGANFHTAAHDFGDEWLTNFMKKLNASQNRGSP